MVGYQQYKEEACAYAPVSFSTPGDVWCRQDDQHLDERHCIRHATPKCIHCDRLMTWVKSGRGIDFQWRCPEHKSHKVRARSGSFWQNSRLSFSKLLQLAFFWSYSIQNKTCEEFTGLQNRTVIQWYQYFRNVCSHYLLKNPIMIGGQGVIVELDVPIMSRKRLNKGQLVPERQIFGGVCPDTQEGFLVLVPDSEATTLLPLIQEHVHPGSIIYTDASASYKSIPKMNVEPRYVHCTDNPVCINSVENYLAKAKNKFKTMCGIQFQKENTEVKIMWRLVQ
ncbi:putative transposase-like protein [Portunus trituberculatus]|uniref:Putative transposase-like protein n=1 Tax=Portunus trituberculatus TaxID=210409 RepID=A0A5B7DHF5_PORTR|nr:putative transposase-like protein [Portunus trituberculatus]